MSQPPQSQPNSISHPTTPIATTVASAVPRSEFINLLLAQDDVAYVDEVGLRVMCKVCNKYVQMRAPHPSASNTSASSNQSTGPVGPGPGSKQTSVPRGAVGSNTGNEHDVDMRRIWKVDWSMHRQSHALMPVSVGVGVGVGVGGPSVGGGGAGAAVPNTIPNRPQAQRVYRQQPHSHSSPTTTPSLTEKSPNSSTGQHHHHSSRVHQPRQQPHSRPPARTPTTQYSPPLPPQKRPNPSIDQISGEGSLNHPSHSPMMSSAYSHYQVHGHGPTHGHTQLHTPYIATNQRLQARRSTPPRVRHSPPSPSSYVVPSSSGPMTSSHYPQPHHHHLQPHHHSAQRRSPYSTSLDLPPIQSQLGGTVAGGGAARPGLGSIPPSPSLSTGTGMASASSKVHLDPWRGSHSSAQYQSLTQMQVQTRLPVSDQRTYNPSPTTGGVDVSSPFISHNKRPKPNPMSLSNLLNDRPPPTGGENLTTNAEGGISQPGAGPVNSVVDTEMVDAPQVHYKSIYEQMPSRRTPSVSSHLNRGVEIPHSHSRSRSRSHARSERTATTTKGRRIELCQCGCGTYHFADDSVTTMERGGGESRGRVGVPGEDLARRRDPSRRSERKKRKRTEMEIEMSPVSIANNSNLQPHYHGHGTNTFTGGPGHYPLNLHREENQHHHHHRYHYPSTQLIQPNRSNHTNDSPNNLNRPRSGLESASPSCDESPILPLTPNLPSSNVVPDSSRKFGTSPRHLHPHHHLGHHNNNHNKNGYASPSIDSAIAEGPRFADGRLPSQREANLSTTNGSNSNRNFNPVDEAGTEVEESEHRSWPPDPKAFILRPASFDCDIPSKHASDLDPKRQIVWKPARSMSVMKRHPNPYIEEERQRASVATQVLTDLPHYGHQTC